MSGDLNNLQPEFKNKAEDLLSAGYVKLSGRILRGSFVSWRHTLLFALAIVILTLIARSAAVAENVSVSPTSALTFSLVLFLIFGTWFFSTRGVTKQGQAFG